MGELENIEQEEGMKGNMPRTIFLINGLFI
jgi:hypothetical protein